MKWLLACWLDDHGGRANIAKFERRKYLQIISLTLQSVHAGMATTNVTTGYGGKNFLEARPTSVEASCEFFSHIRAICGGAQNVLNQARAFYLCTPSGNCILKDFARQKPPRHLCIIN